MTCRIVAEVGANHLGQHARALELIKAAAAIGASHVKFQCFQPEQMCGPDQVLHDGPWKGRNLIELYRETQTPAGWFASLFDAARCAGLTPFASVFHPNDVTFLETLDCPIYKIASFEMLDTTLIAAAARTGKPLVMSTGMATHTEISEAVLTATLARWEPDITLLKCTSAYPADASEANLATMLHMRNNWPVHVGLSDHTPGIGVAVAAAAGGATMIEKHLTLRRTDGGPDAAFSMEPEEFAQMVRECRRAEAAIGKVTYGPTAGEQASLLLRRPPGGKRGVIA